MKLTDHTSPVAGLGTRFLPWTKVVPKGLLPIGNQPIIALIVGECLSIGITDICFVISRGKEMIPQYFYDMPALERELEVRGKKHLLSELSRYHAVNFHVVYQEEMKGDGHAILHAHDWVRDEAIAVLFGDDLISGKRNGMQQLRAAWEALEKKQGSAVLCLDEVEKEVVSRYGIVDIDVTWKGKNASMRKVTGLVEKPKPADAPSNLGIVGKYIIPRSIFKHLSSLERGSKDGEVCLIDALIGAKDDLDIYGIIIEGTRLDTGHPEGYKEAVKMLG